jgi:hypothetical protein
VFICVHPWPIRFLAAKVSSSSFHDIRSPETRLLSGVTANAANAEMSLRTPEAGPGELAFVEIELSCNAVVWQPILAAGETHK